MNRLPVVAPNTRPSFHASNKMRTPDRNQLSHARSGIALIGIILEFAFISVVIAVILIVTNHFLKSQAASLAGQDSAMIQPIFRLSVVSDGRSLWVQRGQKEIDLVEIATGVATKRLRFSESTLTEMRVSDDGLTCLVAIEDQELCIFRDQQLQAVDPAAAGLSSLYGLSPNGRIAVRVLGGTSVRGWDLGQEDPRPFSFVLPEPAERIALDSTGERMLVSTGTGKHSLYEIRTGTLLKSFSRLLSSSTLSADPEFTRDGSGVTFAFGSTIVMYDLESDDVAWATKVDDNSIGFQNLAISIDGEWIAASGVSSGICVLNRNTGAIECQFPVKSPVNRIAFSPSCDHLYCGSKNGKIRVFSISEQREVESICK